MLTSFKNIGSGVLKYWRAYLDSKLIELSTAGIVFIPSLFFKYDNVIAAVTLSVSGFLCPNIYTFSISFPPLYNTNNYI